MDTAKFSCRTCKKDDLIFVEMKKERYLMYKNRGICKQCHSSYNTVNGRLLKAKRTPDNSLTCDDCDGVFSKYQTGSSTQNNFKKLRTYCPFCKSENLDRY